MKYILLAVMLFYAPVLFAQELLSDSEIKLLNSAGGLDDEYPGKPPFEKYYNNVLPTLDKIERGIKESSDPNWWYYRYLAYQDLIDIRISELEYAGMKYKEYQQDEKVKKYMREQNISMVKVVELDNDENPQIDAYKYNDIVVGLPEKEALIVMKRILKLPTVGESSGSRADEYMDLAKAHLRLGQFDEAVDVLESMKSDRDVQIAQQDTGEFSNEWIQQQIRQVKKLKKEAAMQSVADTYTEKKSTGK